MPRSPRACFAKRYRWPKLTSVSPLNAATRSPIPGFVLRLLLVPSLAALALVGLVPVALMVFGFPEESRRANQVMLAPGINDLRVVYGAWGLPDEVELRVVGATPAGGDRQFEVGPESESSDVIRLDRVTCTEDDHGCRASLASETFELTVINTTSTEAAVVFEAVARDDEGIESTSLIRLDVLERVVP